MDAIIHVHTFKEGFLSKLAHDLLLNLRRFTIEVEGAQVRVVAQSASLEVLGIAHDGTLKGGLSDGEKQTIAQNMDEQVLQTKRFPEVRFTGSVRREHGRAPSVHGQLELCGVVQPLEVAFTREGDRLRGTFEIVPSRFGIKPFRALAGALKVQDRVRVTVNAQAPEDHVQTPADGTSPEVLRWGPRG